MVLSKLGLSNCISVVQSFVGRCAGYNKKEHNVEFFCDILRANEFLLWDKSKFSCDAIPKNKYINSFSGEFKLNSRYRIKSCPLIREY